MKEFDLRITALQRDFYHGPCESLVFTTVDNLIGILAGHAPTVYAVDPGELHYTVNGKTEYLAVGAGMARCSRDGVTILVDFAERADEIDEIRARDARERAEAAIRAEKSDQAIANAEAALGRAMARLKVAGHGRA